MSCHQVAKKVVGPSFQDVAKKYKGDAKAADHIVTVIKKGGKGVWGPVPMPPHPQVSDENAKKLADWVHGHVRLGIMAKRPCERKLGTAFFMPGAGACGVI
jgi:cytochrome c551/c552